MVALLLSAGKQLGRSRALLTWSPAPVGLPPQARKARCCLPVQLERLLYLPQLSAQSVS